MEVVEQVIKVKKESKVQLVLMVVMGIKVISVKKESLVLL